MGQNFAYKTEKHIRYNFERSPDSMVMDSPTRDAEKLRYHIIVADKSKLERKRILEKIAIHIASISYGIELIRESEGDIKQGKNSYTFVSWDTVVAPRMINFKEIFPAIPIVRDKKLYERKVLNLEESVQDNIYA
jgi:hypothetical protein